MCGSRLSSVMSARVHPASCAVLRSRADCMCESPPAPQVVTPCISCGSTTTRFSAPRARSFVIPFVTCEEANSPLACAPPPPDAGLPSRSSRRFAPRTLASTLSRSSSRAPFGRGCACPCAQASSSTYRRRACRAARSPARSGSSSERPSRHRLDDPRPSRVVPRRPRVVFCVCRLPPQGPLGALPARHARRAARRQARGRRARRWRPRRRRRARRRCTPPVLSMCVCTYRAGVIARFCMFLRHSHAHSDCTFHIQAHGGRPAAYRRPHLSREHARARTRASTVSAWIASE